MARLALGTADTKACSATLLAFLSFIFTGCANSCFFGFWNPPNGTIGTVISNPPPACKLASPKATIGVVMQVSRLCESCSGSNRVHTVVLSLGGIDVHSSANAVGESSGWQPLFPELGKQPRQVELLSEKMIALSFASSEELSIPAGSYDHVRLRVAQNQVGSDREPLLENRCGQAGLNCVIMADGQVAPLAFEANILEFRLTSQVTDGGSPFVLPDSNNELLIELSPVQSMAQPLGEATRSIVVLPTEAHLEPRPRGKAMQERERISPNGF